jgi:hypothetical protein
MLAPLFDALPKKPLEITETESEFVVKFLCFKISS